MIAKNSSSVVTLLASEAHSFATIVGHDAAKQYFKQATAHSVLPHSILLHGPVGVGKMSMVYALIRNVLTHCAGGGAQEWVSDISRRITHGLCLDIQVVSPRGAARQITLSGWRPGKDDPDDLQYYRFVDVRPIECPRKFLIFEHADRMNLALGNLLLKLIEEPPDYLTIVLLTDKPSDVLPTIRSRCAPVQLSPLTDAEMLHFFEDTAITEPQRNVLLRLAEGRPGRLPELQSSTRNDAQTALAEMMLFYQRNGFVALFRTAADLLRLSCGGGSDLKLEPALDFLQSWFRDVYLLKTMSAEVAVGYLVNSKCQAQLAEFAGKCGLVGVAEALDCVDRAYAFAPRQTDMDFVLENLLIQIGKALKKH